MINTLAGFINFVCVTYATVPAVEAHDLIYDAFEDNTTEEVIILIYSLAEKDSLEPFRSAMNRMGFSQY